MKRTREIRSLLAVLFSASGLMAQVSRGGATNPVPVSKGRTTLGFERLFAYLALTLLFASSALAVPITYTGFTITDGKIGAHAFHNARVILTFVSDTANVQLTTIQGVAVAYNPTGSAHVTIVGDKLNIQANFAANQIFVSFDLKNGGVGFGSFAPNGSLQVTYPMAVDGWMVLGALPAGSFLKPSPEEAALSTDLMHNTAFAGSGWTCPTFPLNINTTCPLPTAPLKTDRGDLYLYEPYEYPGTGRTINAGFFFADLGTFAHTLPANVYVASSLATSGPMTYHAFIVADVTLGKNVFKSAKVLFTFVSNSSSVQLISGSDPNAYINRKGTAQVAIMTGSKTVNATFAANQIYVYFTPATDSMGFGSNSGGRGYPVALANGGCQCYGGIFTAYGVADILDHPANASQYTPQVATLITDLRNRTALGDNAYSCKPFDPYFNPGCSNLKSPPQLTTNNGAFRIYEPYNRTDTKLPVSLNGAMFWSSFN